MVHYKLKDYIMAAHYFKTFTQGFPRSEHVEEFLYMSAYCKYLLSPRPSLDQTETREAITELQSFINRFPQSSRVEEANGLIDELRQKLETKAFEKAVLYFNVRDYTAAVTTFNNVIRDYPDTQYREEALFYIIQSYFLFAENSISIRQLERYQEVVTAYNRLVNRFPESKFLPDADRMLSVSQEQIAILEKIFNQTDNTSK
jgi:outer membrane protein assembly factor BamD